MRKWLVLFTVCLPSFGELPESMAVGGKPNKFSIEELELISGEEASAPSVAVRGKVWNKGEEILLRIAIRVKEKLANGAIRTAMVELGMLDRHQLERVTAVIPGVRKESEVISVSFEAVSFFTNPEYERHLQEEATQRARLCATSRRSLGNKATGALTVNETDLITACKLAGLW